jgi:hypothetical protein
MFIGTSPEFELALYTLCFLAGKETNEIQMAGYHIRIKWVPCGWRSCVAAWEGLQDRWLPGGPAGWPWPLTSSLP